MESRLLAALPEDERRDVMRLGRRRRFGRNEVIFHEGDPGDTLHVLLKGQVAVRVTTPLGDVAMLRVLHPGQVFGEFALIDAAPRTATIVALSSTETLSLHRQHIDELRRSHPHIDELFLGEIVAEVRRLSSLLLEVMYAPVDKRLYRRLAELTRDDAGDGPVTVELTQEDLAQLTGTTRPTINKALRSAEAAGLVKIERGRIEILDRDELARRAR